MSKHDRESEYEFVINFIDRFEHDLDRQKTAAIIACAMMLAKIVDEMRKDGENEQRN